MCKCFVDGVVGDVSWYWIANTIKRKIRVWYFLFYNLLKTWAISWVEFLLMSHVATCVICDLWLVTWFLIHDLWLWFVNLDSWFIICDLRLRFLICDMWLMIRDLWLVIYELWFMICDYRFMISDLWLKIKISDFLFVPHHL